MVSKVSVIRVREDVHTAVREAMQLAEWQRFVTPGADISLKVNLGWDLFLPGAVSAPWVVEGVIDVIHPHVGRIFLVESSQVLVNVERSLRQTGLDEVCRKRGVQWVNMSKGPFTAVDCKGAVLGILEVPSILLETELITLPVMKTHGRTIITGAVKNQWGCLRELRHQYHPVVDRALADINVLLRPRFAVMDGTVGLEGNGPKSGHPRVADLVLASGDIVALDATAARLMGFRPEKVAHLKACAERGLGTLEQQDIELAGDSQASLSPGFRPGKNNTVAVVETLLRRSALRQLIFETPLLHPFCWGAKLWYFAWYYLLEGQKARDEILAHPFYGGQWRRPRKAGWGW
jgi:uncharacterized protein (DUF362 family)